MALIKPEQLRSGSYNITGSLFGTSSYSTQALTASYVQTAQTASYLNTLNQNLTFNGNLTVNGTASITYLNVAYETASVIYSSGSNQFGDAANDTQTLYGNVIVPTGSVGIGTTSPSAKLQVENSGSVAININDSSNSQIPTINFQQGGTTKAFIEGGVNLSSRMDLGVNTNRIMTLSSTGNVGIGTTTPSAKLDVNGNVIITGSFNQASASLASGLFAHAQGLTVTASGAYSHAEGVSTKATGDYSHAEGNATIAIGAFSHAEGDSTIAPGNYSHAEGESTNATGESSHAEGYGTTAAGSYQHVQGQYNLVSSAQSAFIHGNGTSDVARSNLIFASGSQVQITGSAQITGSLIIQGNSQVSGSLIGQVTALSISSNTASLNMSTNNFFTLALVNGTNTNINPTNINPGQTVNILVSQSSAGTGTVTFPSIVKQLTGSLYTVSAVANAVDIVTMITFDTSTVYVSSIRNLV